MRVFVTRSIVVFALLIALGTLGLLRAAVADAPLPAAREGCMNQWMFNGIWRVRVTKVDPLNDDGGKQVGWLVTEVWRNGTDRKYEPGSTGSGQQVLVLGNGSTITVEGNTLATLSQQDLNYHDFPPSAQYTHRQKFLVGPSLDPANKPAAVIIPFDTKVQSANKTAPQYTMSPASYKIKLDCTATGQQAQGGSYELPAKPGCLNQWLANGFFKARVTSFGPDVKDGTQIGWQVTQEWANVSGRKLTPGGAFVEDEQLVLENGDTVSSGNNTLTGLASQQYYNHEYAPGASWSYSQAFRYDRPPFDPSNKPVKLLIVFDVGAYTYFNQKPYPGNPPNFRISFNCHK